MSIFNDKALKGVADAVSKIVEAEKMATKDHDQDGKIETGKAEYLGSRIRAAKMAGKLKEEEQLDEYESKGGVFKHKAKLEKGIQYGETDWDKEEDESKKMTSSPKRAQKGYGARQNTGMRGQSDGTKKTMKEAKLSFTEMLHLYNESGIEVISKIAPQTVKFGDTEVELIDANEVNGAVAVTVAEEVDNETFTKEVEAQKAKNAGGGKKAEVAKASVQAVKQEEVELEERAKWRTSSIAHNTGYRKDGPHGGIENTADTGKEDLLRGRSMNSRYGSPKKSDIKVLKKSITKNLSQMKKEEVEQIDEISKSTLGSYIKKASHDVAAKGAFTRHFADKSRAETAEQKHDIARKTMKKADKMQDAGMKRRANMAKAVDRLTKEDVQIDERTLTPAETKEKEKNVKGMKKSVSGFKARYGDRAKEVMYATATKMAKKD